MHRFLSCVLALGLLSPSGLPAQTPREITDRVNRLLRGESSRGTVTMEIVTEHWSRSMEMSRLANRRPGCIFTARKKP